jgi:hypothetical protein
MTYPASGSQNQWGPYATNTVPNVAAYTASPTPAGQLAPPQSPSGSVTNAAATFNYSESETSTQEFLADVLVVDSAQQGSSVQNSVVSFNSLNGANFQKFTWE